MLLALRILLAAYASGLILAGILLVFNILGHAYQWLVDYPYKEGRWQAGMSLLLFCVASPIVLVGSWLSVRYLLTSTRRLCAEVLQSLNTKFGLVPKFSAKTSELADATLSKETPTDSSDNHSSRVSSIPVNATQDPGLSFELDEDNSSKIRKHIKAHLLRRDKLRELSAQGIVIPRDIAENLDIDLDQYVAQHFHSNGG